MSQGDGSFDPFSEVPPAIMRQEDHIHVPAQRMVPVCYILNRENNYMNYLYRRADRNKQPRQMFLCVSIGLVILMLIAMMAIIVTTHNIQAFAEIPTSVSGRLEKINFWYHEALQIHIDGNTYVIRKESQYSKRSFGFAVNLKLFDLWDILDPEIGNEIQLEYVQVGSERIVVMLSGNGVKYIDRDAAVNDFIGFERTIRTIWTVSLCLFIILFVLVWKGIIR